MITFTCDECGQLVFFDNTVCTRCDSQLAYDPDAGEVRVIGEGDVRCGNAEHGCGWLVTDGQGPLCRSCVLTRTRPSLEEPDIADRWRRAEAAKRWLLYQADRLGLDFSGATFDLLSSRHEPVTTGHADGVITLDLAEADDVQRTRMREQMGEAYRTLLGHFRHEIGHYVWQVEVDGTDLVESFRETFGDERADYGEALQVHYDNDPPAGWRDTHVSEYATAHPWEDFAETFAHYLHITDVLETAGSFGIAVDGAHPVLEAQPDEVGPDEGSIEELIGHWLPLTYALNEVNRSMGSEDLYPFVLAPTVIAKLGWVHRMVRERSAGAAEVSGRR